MINRIKSFKITKESIPRWVSVTGIIIAILAIVVFGYLVSFEGKPSSPYSSENDKPDRVLQNVICPGLMALGEPDFVFADIHHLIPDKEIKVSTSILAPDFTIKQTENDFVLTDRSFVTANWIITPQTTGKHTIRVTVSTSQTQLASSLTCEITVINTFGLPIHRVFDILGFVVLVGVVFGRPVISDFWKGLRKVQA